MLEGIEDPGWVQGLPRVAGREDGDRRASRLSQRTQPRYWPVSTPFGSTSSQNGISQKNQAALG